MPTPRGPSLRQDALCFEASERSNHTTTAFYQQHSPTFAVMWDTETNSRAKIILILKIGKKVVGLGRFELPTNGLGNRCSIHLSYSPGLSYCNTFPVRCAAGVCSGSRQSIERAIGRRSLRFIRAEAGSYLVDAKLFENGWPVFFQEVVRGAEAESYSVALKGFSCGSLRIRKIGIRQSFRQQRSHSPRDIEGFSSVIRANHDRAAQRVGDPQLNPGMQLHKVSGIIV